MQKDLSLLTKQELEKLLLSTELEISALNNLQTAFKLLMNSLFGAMANQGFRFFNNDIAETITLTGQYILKAIERDVDGVLNQTFKTDKHRYLIYADTDSLFFNMSAVVTKYMPDTSNVGVVIKKLEKTSDLLQTKVNAIVAEICVDMQVRENVLSFKLEKCSDRCLFLARKKYCARVYSSEGVTYAKPKYAVTGLELVRSSTPAFIRKRLKDLLPLVFDTDETTVQQFLATTREEFDKLPVKDIAFPRSANNLEQYSDVNTVYKKAGQGSTPIHVRASLLYNHLIKQRQLNTKYQLIVSGSKIKFVYLMANSPIRENIIAFPTDEDIPVEFGITRYVDSDMQWGKTMLASTQIVLDAVGWQATAPGSNLDSFFS